MNKYVQNMRQGEINKILTKMAEILDISTTQYEDAVSKYQAMANYLGQDPNIGIYSPELYPQGSFGLGTMVKPITDKDEFDIDLVCELKLGNTKIFSQEHLKNLIGNRLKSGIYKSMLKDMEGGRRCWTIEYAEKTQLHLDILPAIPDDNSRMFFERKGLDLGKTAISITDKELESFNEISDDWVKSNPKGYQAWFKEQMLVRLNESRKLFSLESKVKIDDVPDYKVKTPLQRAIQLLKRHRDETCKNSDDKPISIILTTLAAKSYNNEDNLHEAIVSILNGMASHIKYENKNGKRVAIIENPVDLRENFADKWETFPNREAEFFKWLNDARSYFRELFESNKEISWINESLSKGFGEEIVRKTFSAIGNDSRLNRENGNIRMEIGTGLLGSSLTLENSKKVTNHTFHGNER